MPPAASPASFGLLVPSGRFRMLAPLALAAVAAAGWATSNMRPVPEGKQAVILRLGMVAGVQSGGLVRAWPWPFETVVEVPAGGQPQTLSVAAAVPAPPGGVPDAGSEPDIRGAPAAGRDVPSGSGTLSGDGGVVQANGTITWRVTDAGIYYATQGEVPALLRAIFLAAMARQAAGHAAPLPSGQTPETAGAMQEDIGDAAAAITSAMNRDVAALQAKGADLGVTVMGVDVPPPAIDGAAAGGQPEQQAAASIRAARADAAKLLQQAARARDAMLTEARATAQERIAAARTSTATITALTAGMDRDTRPALMQQLYRDRIGPILRRAGAVSTVDAKSVSRLILPGAQ